MIGPLIGMVHLGPLPGAPEALDLDRVIEDAVRDASALSDAGFDALFVENIGDAPFYADDVPKVTVASMTRAVLAVLAASNLPVGVNVLRNDGEAALGIAAATGASFIRVNVLTGTMFTDQGTITGKAAEIGRLRSRIAPTVEVLADVMVKHASPPPGLTLEQAAADTWERGGATGLVVSGMGTGRPLDPDDLERVASAAPGAPIYAGSGVTAETAPGLLAACTGLIVGTSVEVEGITGNPVDPHRAKALVEAVRS